jgi:hypothetical protein
MIIALYASPKLCRLMAVAALCVALLAVLLLAGCATRGLQQNEFPESIANDCNKARAESIKAQPNKPVLPVRVLLKDKPQAGMGAWTVGVNGGYQVSIWAGQKPFYGSLRHEMGPCFPGCESEEAVR